MLWKKLRKKYPSNIEEAEKSLQEAQAKLAKAKKTLTEAVVISSSLKEEREQNHFKERFLDILQGETPNV